MSSYCGDGGRGDGWGLIVCPEQCRKKAISIVMKPLVIALYCACIKVSQCVAHLLGGAPRQRLQPLCDTQWYIVMQCKPEIENFKNGCKRLGHLQTAQCPTRSERLAGLPVSPASPAPVGQSNKADDRPIAAPQHRAKMPCSLHDQSLPRGLRQPVALVNKYIQGI
jgi:hypothetical protein